MEKVIKSNSRNTLSTVSFVLALLQFNVIAAILGHIALKQVSVNNQSGRGLALAAVILGWIQTAVLVLIVSNPYAAGSIVGTIWGTIQAIFS